MMPIWSMTRESTGIGVGFRKRFLPLQEGMFPLSPSTSLELQVKMRCFGPCSDLCRLWVSGQRADTPLREPQRAMLKRTSVLTRPPAAQSAKLEARLFEASCLLRALFRSLCSRPGPQPMRIPGSRFQRGSEVCHADAQG